MRVALVLVLAVAVGCIDPSLTICSDGRACAGTQVCDEVHHSCANRDQLTACAGMADLTPCTSSVSGLCFDGVCLAPGCGNRVVEPGEQCDDGNHVSGDGCSLDCTSTERCGNGIVDPLRGETCDDGNLVSHDGCASPCQIEAATWRVEPVALTTTPPNVAAFDEARHRLVVLAVRLIWEWDGQRWAVAPVSPPFDQARAAAYDPERQRVVAIGVPAFPGPAVVAEWDGVALQQLAIAGTGPSQITGAFFDPIAHEIAVFGVSTMTYLDVVNGKWGTTLGLPSTVAAPRAAYDPGRDEVVLLDPQQLDSTWVRTNTGWLEYPTSLPTGAGWGIVYDAQRAAVVEIGGQYLGGGYDGEVQTWTGAAWQSLAVGVTPRADAAVWYDPATGSLGVFGGQGQNGPLHDVVEIAGTTVIDHSPVQPPSLGPIVFDTAHDRVVMFDLFKGVWTWDGLWHSQPATPGPTNVTSVAYDPVRGGPVSYDSTTGMTWILRDTWEVLGVGDPGIAFQNLTYDYANRRLVTIDPNGTWALPSDGTAWTMIGPGLMGALASIAYDSATQHVVALDVSGAGLQDFVVDHWESTLSPGMGYRVVGWPTRASLLLVPSFGPPSGSRQVWERRAGDFRSLGRLPIDLTGPGGATEGAHGELIVAGQTATSTVMLVRQYASVTADETCVAGEDADADGATGCADPDCWHTCWPACPLATSCP